MRPGLLVDPAGGLRVARLGSVPYGEALALQEALRDARVAAVAAGDERVPDLLLLLEHPAVYTRGRRATPAELPFGDAWYAERGIDVVDVRRGGKVTYHGPGQLVGYLVVATDDVVGVVRALERAMIAVAADHGVAARGRNDEGLELTGAWVEDRKLGSIGMHLSRGVTTHGLGLNVVTDLEPFTWVVPCGLTAPMTSLAAETGAPALPGATPVEVDAAMARAAAATADAVAHELGVAHAPIEAAEVRALANVPARR